MGWKGLARLGVSALLLVALLLWVDVAPAMQALGQVSLWGMAGAVAWLSMGYGVVAWRLHVLCRAAGVTIPARLLLPGYAVGLFFGCFLPTPVGGDAVRILYLARHGYELRVMVVTGVADRLLGFASLGLLAGIALMVMPLWLPQIGSAAIGAGALLLSATVLGLMTLPMLLRGLGRWAGRFGGARVEGLLGRYGESLRVLQAAPRALGTALGLSILANLFVTLSYLACGWSLLSDFPWQGYLIAAPLVMLVQVLPISLGGLGVRELGTVGVLIWLGASEAQAVALSLAYLGVVWLSVLPGLVIAVYKGVRWRDLDRL